MERPKNVTGLPRLEAVSAGGAGGGGGGGVEGSEGSDASVRVPWSAVSKQFAIIKIGPPSQLFSRPGLKHSLGEDPCYTYVQETRSAPSSTSIQPCCQSSAAQTKRQFSSQTLALLRS